MAAKKKKTEEIDPRVLQLKAVREELRALEKTADGLKADILKDYAPGVHPGFVILVKTRNNLDQVLLEEALGDLAPYKKESSATYIEFPKS